MLDIKAEVLAAQQRIRSYIRMTPLKYSSVFSQITGCNAFLKLENLQFTGSFKVRGAMNKLLTLTPSQQAKGVVTASSGNHGAATAFGLHKLNLSGIIFVPENASQTKVKKIEELGANIQFHGLDSGLTEGFARSYAERHDMTYISPYNDLQVIGGQGTIAIELMQQLPQADLDMVFVAVGGGGLISGIAGYLKSVKNKVKIIGCSPENSPVMAASVKAGNILDMVSLPTISDGTAGGVEAGALTFDICRTLVDDYVLVSEAEIHAAMRLFMESSHQIIEGAAGAAIAAFLKYKEHLQGKNVAVIICGANISSDVLKSISTTH